MAAERLHHTSPRTLDRELIRPNPASTPPWLLADQLKDVNYSIFDRTSCHWTVRRDAEVDRRSRHWTRDCDTDGCHCVARRASVRGRQRCRSLAAEEMYGQKRQKTDVIISIEQKFLLPKSNQPMR